MSMALVQAFCAKTVLEEMHFKALGNIVCCFFFFFVNLYVLSYLCLFFMHIADFILLGTQICDRRSNMVEWCFQQNGKDRACCRC